MGRMEIYFKQKGLKPKSRQIYTFAIKAFLKFIYGLDTGTDYEVLAERYLSEEHNYKNDLLGFIGHLRGRPPMSIRTYVSGIIGFLQYNDVELKPAHLQQVKAAIPKGHRAWTRETELTRQILQSLFAQSNVKSRALYLTLLSSGARIGEILQLEIGDINFDTNPVELYIPAKYTKNNESRLTFISQEAAKAVQEWMRVRDTYLKKLEHQEQVALAQHRNNKPRIGEYKNRLFPFTFRVAHYMWRQMIDKAEFGRVYTQEGELIEDKNRDKTTGRSKIHPHMFRKYFRTYLAAVHAEGINSLDAVEVIMGHEGYLTNSYRRMPESLLRAFYKAAEHAVTVYPTTVSSGSALQDQELLQLKQKLESLIEQRAKPSPQEIDFDQLKNNPAFLQWLNREFIIADVDATKEYGTVEG